MKKLSRLRPHWAIIGICTLYSIIGTIIICTWFRYQLNPDATSYFTIAEKYAHGDFRHALNGYWGPMISILLVPAVWLHADMIVASKLLLLLIGVVILITAYWFMYKRKVGRLITSLICALLAMFLLQWGPYSITPDLIIVLLCMWLVMLLNNFIARPTPKKGALLGTLGAAMYFTKGFGLFLFIGVVGLTALWQWWQSRAHLLKIVLRYVPVVVTFLVLVVPFIVLISVKYQKPTINNAGDFDHRIYGPVAHQVVPMLVTGPLEPPNSSAISVWEEPTHVTELVPNWSPLDSPANLHFFLNSILRANLRTTLHSIKDFGALFAFGLVAIVLVLLDRKGYRREAALFTTVSALMVIGYSLVLTETRYLWTIVVYALLAAGLWLASARERQALTTLQITVVGLLVCVISGITTFQTISSQHDIRGQVPHDFAMSLQGVLPQHAHIISNDFDQSYQTCFYLKLQCFGVLSAPTSPTDKKDYYHLLQRLGVTYFVNYHTRGTNEATSTFIDTYFTEINRHVTDNQIIKTYTLTPGL